jgi:hypothetical protein
MLSVKDLTVSKALDRKAMSGVVGGMAAPAAPLLAVLDVFAPSNQFGTQLSTATAFTSVQTNVTLQGDSDVVMGGTGAQALNLGGNSATSANTASVNAVSAPTLVQA